MVVNTVRAGWATQKSWNCVLTELSTGLGVDSPWSMESLREVHPGTLDAGGPSSCEEMIPKKSSLMHKNKMNVSFDSVPEEDEESENLPLRFYLLYLKHSMGSLVTTFPYNTTTLNYNFFGINTRVLL
jgi:hypothetical protein